MASILVIDDDPGICDFLRRVLGRYGHEVVTATGGQTGVALFQQRHPHLTLLDLHLSDMDGIEALKRIRSMGPPAAVIAMTGKGTETLVNQARRLGVADFLGKEWLSLVLSEGRGKAGEEPAQSRAQPRASILVVDDEPMIRDLLRQFVELSGYRAQEAKNGPEALELMERDRPQMMILDMYMPGMNGLEVLRRLKARGDRAPVIVLTASQDEKLLQEALDLGLVALMGKPVDLDRLEVAIHVGLAVQGP